MSRVTRKGYARLTEMDRERADSMSMEELRQEVQRFQSDVPNDRTQLIEILMAHLERNATTLQETRESSVSSGRSHTSTPPETNQPVTTSMLTQLITTLTAQFQAQHEQMMRQVEGWVQ